MKLLLLLLILPVIILANELKIISSFKTSCIQQSSYEGKTLSEQKKILIEKAKQESLEELYGTLISSSINIEDGKLSSDSIKSRAVGAVRVKGDPKFYNGKNLGEICANVHSYITPKDLEKYSPKEVKLKHFCFNDISVSMKDIKREARLSAYHEMIVQYKPAMKNISKDQAENLIHGFKESHTDFDFDTASYCFDAVGTILPYELEMDGERNVGIKRTTKGDSIEGKYGLKAYFYSKEDIQHKKLLVSRIINRDFNLYNLKFRGNKLKEGVIYNVIVKGFIKSDKVKKVKFRLSSDVYDIKVTINGKGIFIDSSTESVNLIKGFNSIKIYLRTMNAYDMALYSIINNKNKVIKQDYLYF